MRNIIKNGLLIAGIAGALAATAALNTPTAPRHHAAVTLAAAHRATQTNYCNLVVLCGSANGVLGNDVYGKVKDFSNAQEAFKFTDPGGPACANGKVQDYDADDSCTHVNWPYTCAINNTDSGGSSVWKFQNAANFDYYRGQGNDRNVIQGNGTDNGVLWVLHPTGDGVTFYADNVLAANSQCSDQNQDDPIIGLVSNGTNQHLATVTIVNANKGDASLKWHRVTG